jgi:hypothetical protein
MFVWLSAGAAVGVLVMLVGVSIAAVFYFRKGGGRRENVVVRTALPIAGAVGGAALVSTIVMNQSALLGVERGAWQQGLIPGALGLTLCAGLVYAALVRHRHPERYARVGHGRPDEVTTPDQQLGGIHV